MTGQPGIIDRPTVSILLVDDSAHARELFAGAIRERLGYSVEAVTSPEEVTQDFIGSRRIDAAVVDLASGSRSETGTDALLRLNLLQPKTKLVGVTNSCGPVDNVTRDAWEALPLASVLSKRSSVQYQLDTITSVVRFGRASPDPSLTLPTCKSPWRTLDGFERLVQHKGHAKLWKSVLACGPNANYLDLALHSGLRLNALRNYRAQLLPELALRGVRNPRMRDLYQFARRCRPFLTPFMLAKGVTFDE